MKIDKHDKDVRLVKIEELAGKKVIPTDLVLYHANNQTCKVEIFIMNKEKTKMKTFEDFKNKVDKNVEFHTYLSRVGFRCYYKGTEGHSEYLLNHAYTEGMVRYNLVERNKYGYNDFTSFTTVEDIENFVVKCEAKLENSKKAEEEKKEKYNSIIDDSLNF